MKMKNNNKGITLVALVITIIILLILAGITIASLTQTGLFAAAQDAKTKTEEKQLEENTTLNEYANEIAKWTGNSQSKALEVNKKYENKTELKDANGNKIVVPAGFKIVSDATTNNAKTVDQGIVIEDETTNEDGTVTATNGSQFVWIPVGDIKKADGTTTAIALNRYTFAENGKPTAQNESAIVSEYDANNNFQELETSATGNSKGSITAFKTSVATNGGFYIGRYEARNNGSEKLTTVKKDSVWNNITQPDAATYSKEMYSAGINSELMNSYAWDTTIVFLQMFGGNDKYSRQKSLNESLATTGFENDKQCNVYDMASNVREWTTETYSGSNGPCTDRGGDYDRSDDCYTSYRCGTSTSSSSSTFGFRPILYF